MFTQVQRPSVPVNHRGCESNLPEDLSEINIATWNVRTLNDETNSKLENLIEEINRLNIGILGVSETHWTSETPEAFDFKDHVIVHSCRNDNTHRQGVAIILKKELSSHMQGYHLINQRIMMIQLYTDKCPLFIFQIYAPDSSYADEDKDQFYHTLLQEISKLPKKCHLLIMGDFNGKVGKDAWSTWPNNAGKFGIGAMNENGERLLQFCAINDLGIINTLYKQPPKRLITWTSPDAKTRNQIDFILAPNGQRRLIKSCRVFNSADIFSDHSLLMFKYSINLPKKKYINRVPKKYNVDKLKNEQLAANFEIKLRNAFAPLMNSSLELEELYEEFVSTTNRITEETVGYRKRKQIKDMSNETASLCEERRVLRKRMINCPTDKQLKEDYKDKNRECKNAIKKERKSALENEIREMEDDFQANRTHNLFKKVKELGKKPTKKHMVLKDANGNRKTETSEVMKLWENHFQMHLNTKHPYEESAIDSIPEAPDDPDVSLIITSDEIKKAVGALKNRKAPGSDKITAEVLKAGGDTMVTMLEHIFQKILISEDTPLHFSKMLVTPVYKKGDSGNPENYRAIALLSIPGKVLNKILLEKIREKTEPFTSESQFGFRPKRGTVHAIFIARQIMEKAREKGIKLHCNFIDFKSAFDTIWRKALWKMLRAVGVNKKIVNIVENMYNKTVCAVAVDGYTTEWFEVMIGVRQGCLLSPTLFNVFLDFVMEEVRCLNKDLAYNDDLNIDLKYADDTTLIAAVFDLLQLSTDQLEKACKKFGMKINVVKSKVMTEDSRDIILEGTKLEKVDSFVLLGSQVPSTSSDVKRRIALASTAFGKLRETIWSRKDIGRNLKVRLLYALILPIATYGCETWSLTKADTDALSVFENNCLRAILNLKRTDKVPIKRIYELAEIKRNIVSYIGKKRLLWFGHVCRLPDESMVKKAMLGEFKGKRGRGRPPQRWIDLIKSDTALPVGTARKYAKDRVKWRRLVNTKWCKASDGVC